MAFFHTVVLQHVRLVSGSINIHDVLTHFSTCGTMTPTTSWYSIPTDRRKYF